ncbi:MAG: response regulator [Chloroherpetonaceae bacterium]
MAHTILFVDDERPILSSLAFSFEGHYHVLTAQSGEEALNIIKTQPISVIVSDQRMPLMTGTELLSRVKQISPATMRILLTGYADIEAIMNSLNVGSVFRFVNKPWDSEKLHATIQLACQIYDQMNHLVKNAPMPEPSQQFARTPNEKKSLLFIDTPNNLAALRSLFETEYHALVADSFEQALQLLQSNEISVLTTEAELNGEECVPFIVALRELKPNLATILLTNSKDASLAMRLINQGRIFRYLVKPFTRQTLKDTIREAIHQYSNSLAPETVVRQLEHKRIFNGDTPQIHTMSLNDVIRRVNAKLSVAANY